MIAVIDYDAGNMASVLKALEYVGEKPVVTRDKDVIMSADKVILPGVGAYADAMDKLVSYDLCDVLREYVKTGKPFLGVCLGLQLLFDESEEGGAHVKGLGILPGKVVLFPKMDGFKVPHMGWNSLNIKKDARLFKGINNGAYVYFVHSYYLKAENEDDVAATCEYGVTFHASVEHDNIFACQFHPEKSGDVGLAILKNFAQM